MSFHTSYVVKFNLFLSLNNSLTLLLDLIFYCHLNLVQSCLYHVQIWVLFVNPVLRWDRDTLSVALEEVEHGSEDFTHARALIELLEHVALECFPLFSTVTILVYLGQGYDPFVIFQVEGSKLLEV